MVLQEVTPAEWSALRARPDRPRLIDVREPWEFGLAHLPEAESVPMGDIYGVAAGYDKSADYVIICHHGARSASVCAFLLSFGFKRVRNFAGGLDAWSRTVDPSVPRY
jgi:rhodanese-related sulfurtransferase